MASEALEKLVGEVQAMGRDAVVDALRRMTARFPMDFSADFLADCSEERLKHILLAARLYASRHA